MMTTGMIFDCLRRKGAWLVVVFLLGPQTAYIQAMEYRLSPSLYVASEYDSNLQLRSDEELEASGFNLSPRLRAQASNERLDLDLNLRLNFAQFDEQDLNSDDQYLTFNSNYQLSEQHALALTARLNRNSSRTSEIDDTGLIVGSDRRELVGLEPSWSWQLSANNSLRFSYNIEELESDSPSFTDYRNQSANILWTHVYNDRTQYQAQLGASRFEPDTSFDNVLGLFNDVEVDREVDTYSLQVGFIRLLNESLQASVLTGVSEVRSRSGDLELPAPFNVVPFNTSPFADDDSQTFLLSSSLDYSAERYDLSFSLFSRNQPSADGTLNEAYGADLDLTYRWSERLTLRSDLSWDERETTGNNATNQREISRVSLGLDYRIKQYLTLGTRYRFRSIDRETSDNADGHGFFLSLTYTPEGWIW